MSRSFSLKFNIIKKTETKQTGKFTKPLKSGLKSEVSQSVLCAPRHKTEGRVYVPGTNMCGPVVCK